VPRAFRDDAYGDHPLSIGWNQTISQPYIVALMIQLVRPTKSCRALEIGVGSGYQAAVLAQLCGEVFGMEIVPALAESASRRLAELGYANVHVRCGDGCRGWPEQAPFDVIIVAAAPDRVPESLVQQLAVGGRFVIPIGGESQLLWRIEKLADGTIDRQAVIPVQFVPMTGSESQESGDPASCRPCGGSNEG
jgi:protein-L-isoaspartate(D-aspartate) O-methyltransferase